MRYGSVCSGIEAASVAWKPLGWKASFLSEIEAFPRAVLAHHYPEVPLHGDFTTIEAGQYDGIDVLVGGTPCQSFSVAGLRGGLDDDRGNLALEYLRLADRLRPRWLVWENVPGVLSSNGGRDFGSILGGMGELGYGVAYRVLDAQFLGVAQRRRRVFVVGYLGDWRRAAAVLFERHSLSGNPAPRREAGKAAPTIPSRSSGSGGLGTDFDCDGGLIERPCYVPSIVPQAMSSKWSKGTSGPAGDEVANLVAVAICFSAKDHGADAMTDLSPTLRAGGHSKSHANADVMPAIAFAIRGRDGGAMPEVCDDGSVGTLRAGSGGSSRDYVAGSAVRRLTPRECERLQGFPEITNQLRILVCKSEDEKHALASFAATGSAALALGPNAPVAVDVLIDLERQVLRLHSLGRSPWSASTAELESSSLQPMPSGAFALLAALTNVAVANSTRAGKAASHQSIRPSTHPLNGSALVALSGREIAERASDAGWFTGALSQCSTSTTSQPGSSDPTFVSTLETLSCCVAIATAGFIPEAMRSACSYEIRFTTHHGYTAVPHRGKPAADGPRYKALGNSMAVPVMRWIGERIAKVDAIP